MLIQVVETKTLFKTDHVHLKDLVWLIQNKFKTDFIKALKINLQNSRTFEGLLDDILQDDEDDNPFVEGQFFEDGYSILEELILFAQERIGNLIKEGDFDSEEFKEILLTPLPVLIEDEGFLKMYEFITDLLAFHYIEE